MDRSNTVLVERLIADAAGWPGVEVAPHRFGGTEFRLGAREVGHVHEWGSLDVNYLRRLRDVLVAAGLTGEHHLLADSGWTSFDLRRERDYEQARWLLRLSYLYHVNALSKRDAAFLDAEPDVEPYAGVDVTAELDVLDPSESIRAAFERRPVTA
jgi:hypothetical protein